MNGTPNNARPIGRSYGQVKGSFGVIGFISDRPSTRTIWTGCGFMLFGGNGSFSNSARPVERKTGQIILT